MLKDLNLANVLVLDIETVSGVGCYADLSPTMQYLWDIKSVSAQRTREPKLPHDESYGELAGIFAEFGKIVCISVGAFRADRETGEWHFYVRSYYHHDERQLLQNFAALLNERYNSLKVHKLCGHNSKEFDIPYICRRMVINGVELPEVLDIGGKKPWEVGHLDTLDLWKFGDYKSFTSLKLLCGVFGIPTPKDDIDGSQVGYTYWRQDDLERIQVYCRKDVVATAQVLLSFMNMPHLREDQIHFRDQTEDIGVLPPTKVAEFLAQKAAERAAVAAEAAEQVSELKELAAEVAAVEESDGESEAIVVELPVTTKKGKKGAKAKE